VTQRSAVLNKNVLTQAQILIALRTIAPQDLDAMKAWIDVHGTLEQQKMLMESLPALPIGDAWVWSPGWPTVDGIFKRVHILPIETFDSGKSPEPGAKPVEPKSVADVDINALKRQMADTIERAKAEDPKELKRLLVSTRAELLKAQQDGAKSQQASAGKAPSKVQPALTDAERALIEKLTAVFSDVTFAATSGIATARKGLMADVGDACMHYIESTTTIIEDTERAIRARLEQASVKKLLEKLSGLTAPAAAPTANYSNYSKIMHAPAQPPRAQAVTQPVNVDGESRLVGADGQLKKHVRAILTAFAQHPNGLNRAQVLTLAGYQPSGDISAAFGEMNARAWLVESGGRIKATPVGLQALGPYEPLPVGAALRTALLEGTFGKSSKVERQLLRVWFNAWPNALARKDAIAAAGYKPSGDISAAIGKFIRLDWLVDVDGGIKAADLFFEE
jgi:hypothetical protein